MNKSTMRLIFRATSAGLCGAAFIAATLIPGGSHAQTTIIHGADGSQGSSVVSASGGTVIVNGRVVSGDDAGLVQGTGPVIDKAVDVPGFTAIQLDAPLEVTFIQRAQTTLTISAQENIHQHVIASVTGGKLRLSLKGAISTTQPIRALVTAPMLAGVSINGSGDISASGLTGRALTVDVSGSGELKASGQVEDVKVRVAGSGDVDAASVKAKSLQVRVSGSGNVSGYASEAAHIKVSGSGDVLILGNPKTRTSERNGSGNIRFQ